MTLRRSNSYSILKTVTALGLPFLSFFLFFSFVLEFLLRYFRFIPYFCFLGVVRPVRATAPHLMPRRSLLMSVQLLASFFSSIRRVLFVLLFRLSLMLRVQRCVAHEYVIWIHMSKKSTFDFQTTLTV